MKPKIFIIFIIFSLILIPILTNEPLAQNTNSSEKEVCVPPLMEDKSTGQCIPICGEGYKYKDSTCVVEDPAFLDSELGWISVGIIAGIIVAGVGIFFTVDQRKKEKKRESIEIIQKYGSQLSEIINEENDLKTKIDCALYTERFLDTLEQIAKLYKSDLLGGDVTHYFDNEFRYGRNLWTWYKKNVEKYPDYELKKLDKDLRDNFVKNHTEYFDKDDRWYHFMERCHLSTPKLIPFKSYQRNQILNLRKKRLQAIINETTDEKKKEEFKTIQAILDGLASLFDKDKLEEREIRRFLDQDDYSDVNQLEYVRRYTKGAINNILPDIMELDYEDIPDENGLSNFEVLGTIQKYSERLTELKSHERELISQQDCAIYAEQYLDTLDEIASSYRQKLFPQSGIPYFQNSFGYGINLMNWYFEYVRKDDQLKFDPTKPVKQLDIDAEEIKDDRWIDLRWICRGGDSRSASKIIKPFEDLVEYDLKCKRNANGRYILPDAMYRYTELPDEEGIKSDEILEIMREYSNTLIKITEKETQLKTQVECALYAEQYLDILDQIAYLLNTNALATDSSTFFENNFAFGLTLKVWYDLTIAGSQGQEERWKEFLRYCNNFTDDNYEPQILKAFRLVDVLPASMLLVDSLPVDSLDKTKNTDSIYEQKDGVITNIPEIFKIWEKDYGEWIEKQKELIKSGEPREDVQIFINQFRAKKNITR